MAPYSFLHDRLRASLLLGLDARLPAAALAKPLPALAHRDLLRDSGGSGDVRRLLAIFVERTAGGLALPAVGSGYAEAGKTPAPASGPECKVVS